MGTVLEMWYGRKSDLLTPGRTKEGRSGRGPAPRDGIDLLGLYKYIPTCYVLTSSAKLYKNDLINKYNTLLQ